MPFTTLFSCDSVEFSSSEESVSPEATQNGTGDSWSPAKVSVQDLGSNDRWLTIERDGAPPTVFRAIKSDWVVSSDDRSMIVVMKRQEPDALTRSIQKLRFDHAKPADFWAFLHQVGLARVHEFAPRRG
ncbi:hypothetical protein LXA43DRAFT_1093023 [Ganoderma leucocontextum]|nr:hypothetical protein LXA43DRAFT_1093023 [Ganoderma leucocontextum]